MQLFRKLIKEEIIIFLCVIALSLPIILPLFHSGFLVTDDGDLMLIRFTAFHQTLLHFQFPVRYLPRLNFQYGYPVTNFLYPGYLYLAEVLHLIHFGFINSIKILLGLSLVSSAVFTYVWLRSFFYKFPSFIGSMVYLYAPYHFYDVYKRGSVGEIVALAIIPFIFLAIEKKITSLTILGISFLILSHNTLAVLFLPILFLYHIISTDAWKDTRKMLGSFGIFIVSLLISAFFWVPALYDLQYTVFSQTKVSEIGNYFTSQDTQFYSWLSIFNILFIAVLLFIFKKHIQKLSKKEQLIVSLLSICGIGSLLLNLRGSLFIWEYFPISFIQFPFRLLSIAMIFMAFVTGFVSNHIKGNMKYIVGVLLLLLFCFPTYFFISKISYTTKDDMFYATNEDTTTVKNEYLPIWVKERSYARPETLIRSGNATNTQEGLGAGRVGYTIAVTKEGEQKIIVNLVYFPGWVAYANGVKLPLTYTVPKGLIEITVPRGVKVLSLRFEETPIRLGSDIVSIIGIIMLIFFIIKEGTSYYALRKK